MDEPIDWPLIVRFLSHTCSAEERRAVQAWSDASPDHAATLAEARALWEASAQGEIAPDWWDAAAEWGELRGRLRAPAGRPMSVLSRSVSDATAAKRWWMPLLAAAIIMAVGLAVGSAYHGADTYVTRAGERRAITLADGTKVTLAPATHLTVAAGFAPRRTIGLDGEAVFTVVHDAAHPFAVHAGRALVTDVGTRFDIRNYSDPGVGGATRVTVSEGRVDVTGSAGPVQRAIAGEGIVVDGRGAVGPAVPVDVAAQTAWVRGVLAFEGVPLRDVVAELSRWYGVDISVASGKLGEQIVSATFLQEPLDNALAELAPAMSARVIRDGARRTLVPISPSVH